MTIRKTQLMKNIEKTMSNCLVQWILEQPEEIISEQEAASQQPL